MPAFEDKILLRGSELPKGAPSTDVLVDRIIRLAEAMSGLKLYPYQEQYAWSIVRNVLLANSVTITALFCRQSGKSSATGIISGSMGLSLPWLAEMYPDDWRFNRTDSQGRYRGFRNGVSIGIYAPTHSQSQTTLEKLNDQFSTDTSLAIMEEMGVDWNISNGTTLGLSNRSIVIAASASPNSKIEGKTHHLIVLEECQDLDSFVINKSIMPMLASTAGTCIKVGTANAGKSNFYTSVRRNIRNDLENPDQKTHFFFPDTVAEFYNSDYARFAEQARADLGEDSDAYRMSFKCEFILERGMFVTEQQFLDPNIGIQYGTFSKLYAGYGNQPDGYDIVAGVDFGKKHDSTVATIVAIDWKNPLKDIVIEKENGQEARFRAFERHIIAWKEWSTTDYETQFFELREFLARWRRLKLVTVDGTSLGDVILDRLLAEIGDQVDVRGIVFTKRTNSEGYKLLNSELLTGRLTYPRGEEAKKTREFQRFQSEMLDLEKDYSRDGLMCVGAPNEEGAHDDYADSLMLAVYGSQTPPNDEMVVKDESHLYFLR